MASAGLSVRQPLAMAHFNTVPIRCLTRRAVSGRLFQIGDSAKERLSLSLHPGAFCQNADKRTV
jgi:hypothetical protein